MQWDYKVPTDPSPRQADVADHHTHPSARDKQFIAAPPGLV
jgi:hypothetical protein